MKWASRGKPDFFEISIVDIILIASVLLFSIVSIIRPNFNHSNQSSAPRIALIYQSNRLLEKVRLEKDSVITFLNGRMQIEVRNGKIRVARSDCPQHICMNTGWIQNSGQAIICTPNQLVIEIEPAGPSVIDAVVF